MKYYSTAAALALAVIPSTLAQTFSDCDPTKRTDCPTKAGLNAGEYFVDFTTAGATPDGWKVTSNEIQYGAQGAQFSIKAFGEGPTLATDWHIFGGYVEVVLKAAPGAGVVSSFVLQSDTLDEIDWEMIGSDTAQVQSNYFGKGNTTTYDRGMYHPVPPPQQTFIKYAVNWTMESTVFLLNDEPVRTLMFADAVGGQNYPQTPMNIRLGNWIAGTEGNSPGTIQWAGGLADISQAPFDMFVQSVRVINYSPAASYKYTDQTGSWQSVQSLQDAPQQGTVGSGSTAPGEGSSGPAPAPSEQGKPPVGSAIPSGSNTITINPGGYGGGYGAGAQATAPCNTTMVVGGTTYTISAGQAMPSNGYGGSGSGGWGKPPGNYSGNPFPQGNAPSNGTQPTITIDTAAPSSTLATKTGGSGGSGGNSQQSFGLGGTGAPTAGAQSSGPAQVTANAASNVKAEVGVGLLALVFGYALV